jgi:hypothetical protein
MPVSGSIFPFFVPLHRQDLDENDNYQLVHLIRVRYNVKCILHTEHPY